MIFVYILLTAIIVLLLFFIYRQSLSMPVDISADIGNKLNELFPQLIKNANDSLITMADQKLSAKKDEISVDLTNKKAAIEDMVKRVLDELGKNQLKLETAETARVSSFSVLSQRLEEQKYLTEQLKTTADNLKRVLSSNQLRGAFGEQVAEDLLKAAGFVSGVNYQKQQSTASSSRPDYTLILPDGTKVNIDVKFPYANLVKMTDTEEAHQKDQYLKAFEQDIKNKIKEVSSREYINPEDQTVDFVVLFIPNEMIFSFIYEKLPDIRQDAMTKKVILAGPFSFIAILRMIYSSYDNFRLQKDIQQIVGQIKQFYAEFEKYNIEFQKIGEKIDAVSRQYDAVNTTRTRQLLRTIDKLQLKDSPPSQLPLDNP